MMSNENENWLFFVLCADRSSATTRQQRRRRQRQKQIQRRRSTSSLPLFRSIERSSSKITKMYFFLFVFVFSFACACVCVCARIQTNSFGHLERAFYGLLFLSCPMILSLTLLHLRMGLRLLSCSVRVCCCWWKIKCSWFSYAGRIS